MRILVIGGTGCIGTPLVKLLASGGVDVVSRRIMGKYERVNYISCDANELQLIKQVIIDGGYDVIVDFMIYDVKNYKERLDIILDHCDQYICMSTACVYEEPNQKEKITEDTPLRYDNYSDDEKSNFNLYHIKKSRLDKILLDSKWNNWTLIRPHITVNKSRFPLQYFHKETWLYRALKDKKMIIDNQYLSCVQTITTAEDVAFCIHKLIGNVTTLGQIYNVTSDKTITWSEPV